MRPDRRRSLAWLAASLALPSAARAREAGRSGAELRLAAAWEGELGYRVGLLSLASRSAAALHVAAEVEVPTRAHGLMAERTGTLLAVARRPGDWLLRWGPNGQPRQMHWIEPLRAFNGHLVASPDGSTLYTSETDLETGAGLVGVRDARTLRKHDEWFTHGIDPHELVWASEGSLIVANGGVPTRPETGRVKRDLERMDSSLVRLDAGSGRLLGQWRLGDPRLSLRHLAWNGSVLGIALQAQHDAPQDKAHAPVLAVFDGTGLRVARAAPPLAGYGGSIAASGSHFAVACPRAGGVALFSVEGRWQGWQALPQACALANSGAGLLWAGGEGAVLGLSGPGARPCVQAGLRAGLRLDNHWTVLRS